MRQAAHVVAWGVRLEVHPGWFVTDRPFRRRHASGIPDLPENPAFPELPESLAGARDAPRGDFRRFRVDFRVDFRGFSRLHRASDSTRSAKGRTSVFAGRRSTLEGSQTWRKSRKSTKIAEKSIRHRFANKPHEKNSIFSLLDAA